MDPKVQTPAPTEVIDWGGVAAQEGGLLTTRVLLKNVHTALPLPLADPVKCSLIRGDYQYYHYGCDGQDDRGWGCGYRTIQTMASWLCLSGTPLRPPPSLPEIQRALVDMGDKPSSFSGSKEWIGTFEASLVLDYFYEVPCRVVHVRGGGAELERVAVQELHRHFDKHGSPVMMGGDRDNSSKGILGVCTGDGGSHLLVVDPHYYGRELERGEVQKRGWVAWKRLSTLDQSSFYNLCLPQTDKKGKTVEVEGRDLTCPGITMAKHGTDCYFYYNSTCTAGDTCKFRHSKAAVGSDAVCFLWEKGRCSRPDCKFRHSKKKKKERPCYWERQPQGCQNPRCAFSHERPRNTDGIFSTPNKSVKSELGLSRKRGKKMKDFGEVVNQEVSFMPPQKVFKSVRERLTWPADPIAASQAAETSTAPAFTTPKTTKRGMRAPFAKGKKHWRHEKQKGYRRLHKQKTPNEECHVAPEESPPFSAELQPTVDDASPKQCLSPPQCLNTRSPPQSDNLKETAASSSTFSASAEEQYEDILTEFASNSQGEDMGPCLGERPLTDLTQELVDYANMC